MPAPKRYPTPAEQLRILAQQAKREGLTFDEFWDRAVPAPEIVADKRTGEPILDELGEPKIKPSRMLPRMDDADPPVGAVLWPRDTQNRRDAYEVTVACRDGWRRSYENLPARRGERGIRKITPEEDEGDPRGRSMGAGVPLPA